VTGQQRERWVSCFVLGACQIKPFRRRDHCCCPESRGHIKLPAACGDRVRQGRGKDKGDATWEVSKRSSTRLYCQTAGEELFPEPNKFSGGNLLQCSTQLRGAQLKKQV